MHARCADIISDASGATDNKQAYPVPARKLYTAATKSGAPRLPRHERKEGNRLVAGPGWSRPEKAERWEGGCGGSLAYAPGIGRTARFVLVSLACLSCTVVHLHGCGMPFAVCFSYVHQWVRVPSTHPPRQRRQFTRLFVRVAFHDIDHRKFDRGPRCRRPAANNARYDGLKNSACSKSSCLCAPGPRATDR